MKLGAEATLEVVGYQGNAHTEIELEEALVCEALVREIGQATRWSAALDAWNALMHVRKMAYSRRREQEKCFEVQQQTGRSSESV